MTNFRSVADFAAAVLGISTLVAIAHALITVLIKRNGDGK